MRYYIYNQYQKYNRDGTPVIPEEYMRGEMIGVDDYDTLYDCKYDITWELVDDNTYICSNEKIIKDGWIETDMVICELDLDSAYYTVELELDNPVDTVDIRINGNKKTYNKDNKTAIWKINTEMLEEEITSIGFYDDENILSIYCPNELPNLTSLFDARDMDNIKKISFPYLKNNKGIGLSGFLRNNTSINHVDLGSKGLFNFSQLDRAFESCSNLETILMTTTNNNTSSAYYAFSGCSSLKHLKINGFIGNFTSSDYMSNMFQNCTKLETIECKEQFRTRIRQNYNGVKMSLDLYNKINWIIS